MKNILLVGTPNCGKTSLFNLLTGKFQKVSNYSGITIDAGNAPFLSNTNLDNNQMLNLVDLPGVTTLVPQSLDEGITLNTILGFNKRYLSFNLIVVVLDFHRLEATMSLLLELKELFHSNQIIGIINKVDNEDYISKEKQKKLKELVDIPLLFCSALKDRANRIDQYIRNHCSNELITVKKKYQINNDSLQFIPDVEDVKKEFEIISNSQMIIDIKTHKKFSREIFNKLFTIQDRFKSKQTQKIDEYLLHPIIGSIIFFAIFYFIFLAVYSWSGPMMDLVQGLFDYLSQFVISQMNPGLLRDFLTDGIIAGVGSVIIFLPQILILFFLLSILEQTGYVARAAFLSDRIFSVFGLNGKAFLPYLSGFACAVPAILATRTIVNKKERLTTLLTIPLTTCSARLPIYLLLIGTFVPDTKIFGIFGARATSFFFLYFLGSIFTLIIAKIFRLTMFAGKSKNFFIDLPLYQIPSIKIATKAMTQKGKIFLKKAGTIILYVSIIIWILSNFPKPSSERLAGVSNLDVNKVKMEYSIIGRVGKIIEPVLKPIGMDWRIGIGLLSAFAAREIFVSTIATIFSVENGDDQKSLQEALLSEKNPETGKALFNFATAWSILIFFVFSLQCTSTLAIIYKETGSVQTATGIFLLYGSIAYLASFFTYNLLI